MAQGARELAMRVRDGLLLLEEKEQETPTTLIGELEQEAAASLRAVQNLIDPSLLHTSAPTQPH